MHCLTYANGCMNEKFLVRLCQNQNIFFYKLFLLIRIGIWQVSSFISIEFNRQYKNKQIFSKYRWRQKTTIV